MHIHPFVRVYCASILVVAAAVLPHPAQISAVGIPIIVFAVAASLSWRRWMLGLFAIVSLIVGLTILSILSGMSIASTELDRMIVFTARCLLAFACSSALFQTTRHMDVCKALEYARVPALFTVIAGQILRWFDLVNQEAQRMNMARMLRGGDRKSRIGQIRDMAMLLGTLMIRSFSRAERVAAAMECRGFSDRLPSAIMPTLRTADYAPLIITLVYIAVVAGIGAVI
jgi:cobalt/nickel transport system permease protein